MSESLICVEWFKAADENDVPKLRKYYYKNIRTFDEQGKTALMHAAAHNALDAVKFLLEDEKDAHGPCNWTALMEAVANGSIESIDLLKIQEGVRLLERHSRYKQMTTALSLSAELSNSEAFELLIEERDAAGFSDLHISAFNCNLGEVLENCLIPVKLDLLKRTPVYYLVFNNRQQPQYCKTIHALCRLPCALDSVLDVYGKSPLHYAVEMNNIQAIKALARYYCMIGTGRTCKEYPVNTTALMIAVERKNAVAVEILTKYEHGCKNELGQPAIFYAQQIEDISAKNEIIALLYYKERNTLIKNRVNGKLTISTFEQELPVEESQSLQISTQQVGQFYDILSDVTEDNKQEVCDYLCQQASKSSAVMKSGNSLDLSMSSLLGKNLDTMHDIFNNILDVLLEKSAIQQKSAVQSAIHEQIELEPTEQSTASASQLNAQLQQENDALKAQMRELTQKYSELEASTQAVSLLAQSAAESDSLMRCQKSQIHQIAEQQEQQSQLQEAQVEIQRLFEENESLKKQISDQNQLKISAANIIESENPFKQSVLQESQQDIGNHNNAQQIGSSTVEESSLDKNVFLSINSVSSESNPAYETNRKLNELELQNRQLKEDLQINVMMYEERLQQLSTQLSATKEELQENKQHIEQFVNDNVQLENRNQDLKLTVASYEEQLQDVNKERLYYDHQVIDLQAEIARLNEEKQYTAEYITDLINDLLSAQNQHHPAEQSISEEKLDNLTLQLQVATEEKEKALKKLIQMQETVEYEQKNIHSLQKQITKQTETIMHEEQIIEQLDQEIQEVVNEITQKYGFSTEKSDSVIEQLHECVRQLATIIEDCKKKCSKFDKNLNMFLDQLSNQNEDLTKIVSKVVHDDEGGDELEGVAQEEKQ